MKTLKWVMAAELDSRVDLSGYIPLQMTQLEGNET